MKTSTLTVRVSSEIEKRLAKLASATARSKSFLAAEAIEEGGSSARGSLW